MSSSAATDDRLLIAEEVMLLIRPDDGKVGFALENARYPLVGALLVELAIRGFGDVAEKKKTTYVRASGSGAPGDRLLADALTALDDQERKVARFVEDELPKIAEAVLERLAERGIIERESAKSLWIFTTTHWPQKDSRPEAAVRADITDVIEGRTDPDERTGTIIALLSGAEILNSLKPPLPWDKEIKKRAEAIASSNWDSAAVSAAVESVTSSVAAAVTAVFVATTATTAITT